MAIAQGPAADLITMTMLLLATVGWCLLSVIVAAFWAAVCAGARMGAERQRAGLRPAASSAVPVAVPAPRAASVARELSHA